MNNFLKIASQELFSLKLTGKLLNHSKTKQKVLNIFEYMSQTTLYIKDDLDRL